MVVHSLDIVERSVEGEQDAPVGQVEVALEPRLLRRAREDRYRPLVAAGLLQVELQQIVDDLEVRHESDDPTSHDTSTMFARTALPAGDSTAKRGGTRRQAD